MHVMSSAPFPFLRLHVGRVMRQARQAASGLDHTWNRSWVPLPWKINVCHVSTPLYAKLHRVNQIHFEEALHFFPGIGAFTAAS